MRPLCFPTLTQTIQSNGIQPQLAEMQLPSAQRCLWRLFTMHQTLCVPSTKQGMHKWAWHVGLHPSVGTEKGGAPGWENLPGGGSQSAEQGRRWGCQIKRGIPEPIMGLRGTVPRIQLKRQGPREPKAQICLFSSPWHLTVCFLKYKYSRLLGKGFTFYWNYFK